MVKILPLAVGGMALGLTTDERGWCQVTLLGVRRGEVLLGSQDFAIVAQRLADAVRDPSSLPVCGAIGGRRVAWVTGLNEQHCTLYVSSEPDAVVLLVQDHEARPIAALRLRDADRAEWLRRLEAEPTSF